ncbi:subtype B tannase [Rhodoferax sp.]|uniref:subtype B tannase n=1 Tax=Rhodoferax sp. TaxID=50421 RepID=UPI00374CABBA
MTYPRYVPKAIAALAACMLVACSAPVVAPPADAPSSSSRMNFDASRYQTQQLVVDGQAFTVRAFENIVYVAQPVDTAYQAMNIYVPEAYFHGQAVGKFNAQTAPIFLPNQIGGYMPAKPGTPTGRMGPPGESARASTIAVALSQGFVVASPGARGRTTATGKAPAAIVDLKAAVRYLRYNDQRMPGDAEKIISNGTSAGGAMSALLGASGNSPDYAPALAALGAADVRDDIFAVSAYCPITNLEHADSAYEWLFNGVNDYKKIEISMLDFNVQRKEVAGNLAADQISLSGELKALFPSYLNSLALRGPQGQALVLDSAGNGSFKEYIRSLVIASAQTALNEGKDLSGLAWLSVQNGVVMGLDWDGYVRYAGRMKLPPAFDALDLGSGENQLFGTATVDKQHFTDFSTQRNTASGASQADTHTVKMVNAMAYIGAPKSHTAGYWRIRHGTKDRDTSLAVPAMLATSLQNRGYAVDFALPWDRPHSGDYDLTELFAWMTRISTAP